MSLRKSSSRLVSSKQASFAWCFPASLVMLLSSPLALRGESLPLWQPGSQETSDKKETTVRAKIEQQAHSTDLDWREALSCGPNALFIFLDCHGYKVSFRKVRELIPITDRGVSLAELWKAAELFDAKVAVVKTDLEGLKNRDLPAILFFDGFDMPFGHFTVLTSIGDGVVTCIDPVSTVTASVDVGTFQRQWTGYALVHDRDPLKAASMGAIVALAVTGVGWATFSAARKRRPNPDVPSTPQTIPQQSV